MNKEEKCVWKVALRLNLLTKDDPNDCIAEVVPPGATKHNIDIAREILKRGSEFRLETITSILDQRDAAVLDAIEHGYSFADNLVQALPRVTGVWKSPDAGFDAAVHKRTVDLVPTQALRDALEKVSVVSSGLKTASAHIGLVSDTATGKSDGTITAGDDISIEGEKIKIQDEADENQGVFIVDCEGKEHRVSRRLSVNKPSHVIARVPASVPAGECKVLIKTKYAGSSSVLKEARTLEYRNRCVIVAE